MQHSSGLNPRSQLLFFIPVRAKNICLGQIEKGEPMSAVVYVFPGQGSQKKGMLKDVYEAETTVRQTFAEASDCLGYSMERLCFEDPENQLNLTAYTQPALLCCSVALLRCLESKTSLSQGASFAGHSLGEYSALVACGVLKFGEALRLVRLRGEAMQKAVPVGEGAMAAIVGVDPQKVDSLCSSHSSANDQVAIANENSPSQVVVSGHAAAVKSLCEQVKTEKLGRAIPLPVSAPFHSRLMQPAADAMRTALQEVELCQEKNRWEGRICANIDAQIYSSSDYHKQLLVDQVTGRVRWSQSLFNMVEATAQDSVTFVEIGPGSVLQGLVKKTLPAEHRAMGTDSVEKLQACVDSFGATS